ncbi:MAG: hypothetical protein WDA17_01950 [Sphaerochaetaceae bacterium]
MIRQGDFIKINSTCLKEKYPDAPFLLIITHCCDLAHDPNSLEVLPCHEIDGNYTQGKHPRKLHFEKGGKLFEARAKEKERIFLSNNEVFNDKFSFDDDRFVLQNWLALQYKRVAIDTEVNKIFKAIKLKDIAKNYLEDLIGIWVDIQKDETEEIPQKDQNLYLSAFFVFNTNSPNFNEFEERIKKTISSRLEKLGINRKKFIIYCLSEDDFSLFQARHLSLVNFEYLSES